MIQGAWRAYVRKREMAEIREKATDILYEKKMRRRASINRSERDSILSNLKQNICVLSGQIIRSTESARIIIFRLFKMILVHYKKQTEKVEESNPYPNLSTPLPT